MSQAKPFASQADLQDKHVSFTQLSPHAWAYTAEGERALWASLEG